MVNYPIDIRSRLGLESTIRIYYTKYTTYDSVP